MGLTSEVLRKMRLQSMDDHRRDVAEICRNHETQPKFGISSSVPKLIVVFLAQCCVEAALWLFQKLTSEAARRAPSKFCDKNLQTNSLSTWELWRHKASAATGDLKKYQHPLFMFRSWRPISWASQLPGRCQLTECAPVTHAASGFCQGMSTCSASQRPKQDTKLLGASENAEAKHLQTPVQHDFCCVSPGNQRGFWIPKRMIRKPTYANRKPTTGNQTIIKQKHFILPSLRNRYHNLLTVQKWWFGRTCFEPKTATIVPRCSQLEKV